MTDGAVVWFTGLPASGKTTLATRVRAAIVDPCVLLDSDEVRDALGATGYSGTERDAFYHALGGLAALLARQGLLVLVAATAPRRAHRDHARARAPRFVE
ncbi:MAG TPA: adenylyl-sulfate kinase, partial [Kofleriaceae bacterium]|nr:adenylyl-sulfate kinase [Kofleriaceae bacterium]